MGKNKADTVYLQLEIGVPAAFFVTGVNLFRNVLETTPI
jgi:hypothetical protein